MSVVASGAVSQPWLHNGSDNTVGGGPTSQGRSMCGMATVFESIGSSGSENGTPESLRGRSEHTTTNSGSSHGPYCQAGNTRKSCSSGDAGAKRTDSSSTHSQSSPIDTPAGNFCANADSTTARMGPSAPAAAVELAVRNPAVNSAHLPASVPQRSGSSAVLGEVQWQPSNASLELARNHRSHTEVAQDEESDSSSSNVEGLDCNLDVGVNIVDSSRPCTGSTLTGGGMLRSEHSSTTHPFVTAAEDLSVCVGEEVRELAVPGAAVERSVGELNSLPPRTSNAREVGASTATQSDPPDCVVTLSATAPT